MRRPDATSATPGSSWSRLRTQRRWTTCLAAFQAQNPRPQIVLLTIDALRADTFVKMAPAPLRKLLSGSAVFTHAYAPSPNTYGSVPALLSGRDLSDLATRNPLREQLIVPHNILLHRLHDLGYRNVAVTLLAPQVLSDGFDSFGGFAADPPGAAGGKSQYYAGALAAQARQQLSRAQDKPLFLWLHQTDVHGPYVPINRASLPQPPGNDYERAAYYTLSRSWELLDRVLREGKTVIVITADHGEELGRNGRYGHGDELTEDVLRVPLILHVPGCPGLSIHTPVSLVDVAPALLELTGYGAQRWSLLDAVAAVPRPWPVAAESMVLRRTERALIVGDYKLRVDMATGSRVAFDLGSDPGETQNRLDDPVVNALLEQGYDSWLSRPAQPEL